VGAVDIYLVQVTILGISIALAAGLYFWLYRTRAGRAIRAVAEDPDIASTLGVDTDRTIAVTVVAASMAGGAAGVLIGMAFGTVNTQMGVSMGLKGLAIIIFGGMGSVPGAVAGGLILGLAESLVAAYGDSGYRDAVAFFIITLVLLIRPQGLFGRDVTAMRS
jgi:branched-chain amino acid transport system permease protein